MSNDPKIKHPDLPSKVNHGLRLLKTLPAGTGENAHSSNLNSNPGASQNLKIVPQIKQPRPMSPLAKQLKNLADSLDAEVAAILKL